MFARQIIAVDRMKELFPCKDLILSWQNELFEPSHRTKSSHMV